MGECRKKGNKINIPLPPLFRSGHGDQRQPVIRYQGMNNGQQNRPGYNAVHENDSIVK
jgi:hypothetical protein